MDSISSLRQRSTIAGDLTIEKTLLHGERAAVWLEDHMSEIENRFGRHLASDEKHGILYTVALHNTSPPDERRTSSNEEFCSLLDLFKTADAMDRYRLPKRKWSIDPTVLRIKPPRSCLQMAFTLVVISERHYRLTKDNLGSVLSALGG